MTRLMLVRFVRPGLLVIDLDAPATAPRVAPDLGSLDARSLFRRVREATRTIRFEPMLGWPSMLGLSPGDFDRFVAMTRGQGRLVRRNPEREYLVSLNVRGVTSGKWLVARDAARRAVA
jgi:hypothetical protein